MHCRNSIIGNFILRRQECTYFRSTFFLCTTPILHTFLWKSCPTLTRVPCAMEPAIWTLWISAKNTIFLLPRASCPVFWKWPYTKLQAVKDNDIWLALSTLSSPTWQNKQLLLSNIKHKQGMSMTDSFSFLFSLLTNVKCAIYDSIGHWTRLAHLCS